MPKIEIKGNEIEGATVTVEYKIIVTNVGELEGTVEKIVDQLPEGFSISNNSSLWAKDSNGELINNSLASKKIKAGESAEITLTASKKMTTETTGSFKNTVQIYTTDNNTKNNTANIELLISIKTGAVVYTSIAIGLVAILSIAFVFLHKKRKINVKKLTRNMFLAVIFTTVVLSQNAVQAAATWWESRTCLALYRSRLRTF